MATFELIPDLTLNGSIAIVGSGSHLLNHEDGEIIDSFDHVVRFNRAPTSDYGKYVGSKTTVRVVNQHVFGCVEHKGWETEGQSKDFIKHQENQIIIMQGPDVDPKSGEFWANRHETIHKTSNPYKVAFSKLKDEFSADVHPSVGISFIWLCVKNGLTPCLFGFDDAIGAHHYWEDKQSVTGGCHDFRIERDLIEQWTYEGKIKHRLDVVANPTKEHAIQFHEDDRAQRLLNVFPSINGQINVSYVNSIDHVVAWHKHNVQTDYWTCVKGSIKVGLASPTGDNDNPYEVKWEYLSDKNFKVLEIPPGIYHGYKAIEPGSILLYYLTEKYDPQDELRAQVGEFGEDWKAEDK